MPNDILTRAIDEICAGTHLTADHTSAALTEIMEGRAGEVQTGAFLIALRAKGETVAELVGLARTMRDLAAHVEVNREDLVDTAGTGGGPTTFNISTTAALIAAGAGCAVAKHGNRSATSRSGSADLLEALGVAISLPAAAVAATVAEVGIGFCFAPVYHPSYRHAGPPRRELGIPTVFNFLGPLTNPAQPAASAIGCGNARMAPVMAEVFATRRWHGQPLNVLLFRGDDGLDELTTTTTSTVWAVRDGAVSVVALDPALLGIDRAEPADLRGGDVADNVAVARSLLAGKTGPVRDAVLLNAAAGLAAHAGLTGDLLADLQAGIERASTAVDSGAAAELLERWVAAGQRLSGGN
jgi:anthranilate phosphoribosyltransferase